MGNLCCCVKSKKNNAELKINLISDIYCDKCKKIYISSYEYNRHIVNCNLIHGDI